MAVRSNWTTTMILLALSLALVFGQQQLNGDELETKVGEFLEQVRGLLSSGYPEHGVPTLDPWRVQRFTMRLTESSADVDVNIETTDVNIWNLKTFKVNSLQASVDPLQANISISIPVLRITADHYTMKGTIMHVYTIRGNGKMELNLRDVLANVTVTLNKALSAINDLDVKLTVSKLQAKLTGTQGLVNSLLNVHGANLINGKSNDISAAIKSQLVPILNGYLDAVVAGKLQDLTP